MLKNFAKTILVVKPAEQKSPAEKKPPAEQNPACDTVPESPDKNDISMDGTSSTSFEDSTIAQEIDVSM